MAADELEEQPGMRGAEVCRVPHEIAREQGLDGRHPDEPGDVHGPIVDAVRKGDHLLFDASPERKGGLA